jgi:hypothetical protein
MGRASSCTPAERRIIQSLRAEGKSLAEIARLIKRSKTLVFQALKPPRAAQKRGRKRKTTDVFDRLLARKVKADPFVSATRLKTETGAPISARTIRRRLQGQNLNSRAPRKVPLLSKKNIRHRLKFAREHLNLVDPKKPDFQWQNILWSDESKINLFGSDSASRVRRPPNTEYDPRHTVKTLKHGGGNIKIWGCFSFLGVGPIFWIKETMTKETYRDILQNVMLPYARDNMGREWRFQQDNDPKHASKIVKDWFHQNQVSVIEWPSQSPDLNPIEHLWRELKKALPREKIVNKQELWREVQKAWYNVPKQVCENLVSSMNRRCSEVIKNRGRATRY